MNSNNHITVDQIKNDAEVIKKELVEWRHYLHAHPELSFKEERTTHYIVNKLKNFGYTDIQIGFGPLKTGVMVVLPLVSCFVLISMPCQFKNKQGLNFALNLKVYRTLAGMMRI